MLSADASRLQSTAASLHLRLQLALDRAGISESASQSFSQRSFPSRYRSPFGSDAFFGNSIVNAVDRTQLPFNPTPCQKRFSGAWTMWQLTCFHPPATFQILHK